MISAALFDGATAVCHAVSLEVAGATLRIEREGGGVEVVQLSKLLAADVRADTRVFGHRDIPGWRLVVPRPLPANLTAALPRPPRYGGWIDRLGLWRATAIAASLSAGVLAIGYFVPAMLAPLVPVEVERRFGDLLIGDFGGKFCSGPAGARALGRLAAQLDGKPRDLNIRIVDIGLVNAIALPGGNIVIFNGLIDKADSPDVLAGVLAHEIAHVRRRHVTAALLRQFGVSLVVTTLGGSTGGNIDALAGLSYSRSDERQADGDALDALRRSGISPVPTARFFARMAEAEGAGRLDPALVYFSSHPLSADRQRRFEAAAKRGGAWRPALTADEWRALKAVCRPN